MSVGAYVAHFRTTLREDVRFFVDNLLGGMGSIFYLSVIMLLYSAISTDLYFGRFTWPMMVWYLIIVQVLISSQANVIRDVNKQIQHGEIVSQLARPYHYPLALLGMHLGRVLVHSLAILVFAIPFGLIVAGSGLPFVGILACILAGFVAILVDFFISLSLGLIAFWTEDARPYYWIYGKVLFILGGLIFPLDIFPPTLQEIAKLLPPAFLMYYPGTLAVDFSWGLLVHTLLGQAIYLALGIGVATIVYRLAVRKVSINGG